MAVWDGVEVGGEDDGVDGNLDGGVDCGMDGVVYVGGNGGVDGDQGWWKGGILDLKPFEGSLD